MELVDEETKALIRDFLLQVRSTRPPLARRCDEVAVILLGAPLPPLRQSA